MEFAFGDFLISIDGNIELITSLFSDWKSDQTNPDSFCKCVNLHLDSDLSLPVLDIDDGWKVISDSVNQKAYYSVGGKTIFSLEYDYPVKDIKVCFSGNNSVYAKMGIQYAVMLALHDTCIGLHGVTLLINNEIVILSAPSGTGKTTLSKLLETYSDAIIINGDFALLRPTPKGVVYEPTPFCGSSTRSLNHRLKINRVVFLEQGRENLWRDLSGRDALTSFLSNSFVPDWDCEIKSRVTDNIINCISALKVSHFAFLPVSEAAMDFEKHIDNYDEQSSCL